MSLKIREYPDPILKQKCNEVTYIDEDLKSFVTEMEEVLQVTPGLGLAAPQVGLLLRLFIVPSIGVFVNPVVLGYPKKGFVDRVEGCLSIPGIRGLVRRHRAVTVQYYDLSGQEHTQTFTGDDARVVQHELDHLDGVLFIERLRHDT